MDKSMNYIGIDGGGTKTEFVLFTQEGHVSNRLLLTSSNPNDIGLDESCKVLAKGIDYFLSKEENIKGLFAGLSGGSGNNKERIHNFLQARYDSIEIHNDTDAINLLASSNEPNCKIALISGTGSIAYVNGNYIGGWGYLFDKAGSGYDIGRDAISAALAQGENLGDKTLITDLLKEEFPGPIREYLDVFYREGKPFIASKASIVFKAYKQGDKIAKEILERNAKHLAKLVTIAQTKHKGGKYVVIGGGIFNNYHEIYLPMVEKDSPAGTIFILPKLPPIYGACVECLHRLGIKSDSFFENFYSTYFMV